MPGKSATEFCLAALARFGAGEAQCSLTATRKHQMKAQAGRLSMLRSASEARLDLRAVRDGRQGQVSISAAGRKEIEAAAKKALESAAASASDAAYGISEFQPAGDFRRGDKRPDLNGMRRRLLEFLGAARRMPGLNLMEASLEFTFEEKTLANSNGVRFRSEAGTYALSLEFSSRKGGRSSSINFAELYLRDLSRPLLECGSVKLLLEQSADSVAAKPVQGKFSGDIVVSPECLGMFLYFLTEDAIRDARVIAGTGPYKDKVGSLIADGRFTLRSMPLSPDIAAGYFFTADGYKAENAAIVEGGRLKTLLLSRYGAKKTGLPRALNQGGCYVMEPGTENFKAMLRSVKKGLLVTRFSGGMPNQKGDFSGVAKNSFYIENGKIKFPVAETMIAGNIPEMLLAVKGISKERVNLGNAVYPWVTFSGVTVSGK